MCMWKIKKAQGSKENKNGVGSKWGGTIFNTVVRRSFSEMTFKQRSQ